MIVSMKLDQCHSCCSPMGPGKTDGKLGADAVIAEGMGAGGSLQIDDYDLGSSSG